MLPLSWFSVSGISIPLFSNLILFSVIRYQHGVQVQTDGGGDGGVEKESKAV